MTNVIAQRMTARVDGDFVENDRIIDNHRTRKVVESFATNDKAVIEYPRAHHTLEFEPNPERFIEDVRVWLDEHSPRSQAPPGNALH